MSSPQPPNEPLPFPGRADEPASEDREFSRVYRDATTNPSRQQCPSSETLVDLVAGQLSPEVKRDIVLHLAECAECSAEVRQLKRAPASSDQQDREPVEEAVVAASSRRSSWAALAAAALLLALLVPAVWINMSRSGPAPDTVRSGFNDHAAQPTGEIDILPRELSWQGLDGATSYRVRLLDDAALTLWESELLDDTSARLPETVLELMRTAGPGGTFAWVVEVQGRAARAELGPYWFRVADPGGVSAPTEADSDG